jgi:hypothetical protein
MAGVLVCATGVAGVSASTTDVPAATSAAAISPAREKVDFIVRRSLLLNEVTRVNFSELVLMTLVIKHNG